MTWCNITSAVDAIAFVSFEAGADKRAHYVSTLTELTAVIESCIVTLIYIYAHTNIDKQANSLGRAVADNNRNE